MEDKIQQMMAEIRQKSVLEQRYYQGAIDSLQLLLDSLKAEKKDEQPEPVKSKSSKGPKP